MTGEDGFIGVLGATVLGIFGWALNLNSRVGTNEIELKGLRDIGDTKLLGFREVVITRFDDIDDRLKRIERHVLNGSYHNGD